MGYLPSFRAEGAIYGRAIAKQAGAKIAVLSEASDFGKDLSDGLKQGRVANAAAIVAEQAYQPTDTSIDSRSAGETSASETQSPRRSFKSTRVR